MPAKSIYKVIIKRILMEAPITTNILFHYVLKFLVNKTTTRKSVKSSIKVPLNDGIANYTK